jgi:hypothetical protein
VDSELFSLLGPYQFLFGFLRPPFLTLTHTPQGPPWRHGQRRTASNVQANKGTAEAGKKGKEGGEEGEEGRQKSRYVECPTKVSLQHVATPPG